MKTTEVDLSFFKEALTEKGTQNKTTKIVMSILARFGLTLTKAMIIGE